MLLRVDHSSTVPLNEQIAGGIRRAIADGQVGCRDRLPPARDLALSLDVNVHTVLKAYGRLREEGLIEVRRGRGVTVVGEPAARVALVEAARSLVESARLAGLQTGEIRALVEVQL